MAEPVFVAMTMNYWGKGPTAEIAESQMLKAGGKVNAKKYGFIIKLLPEGATNAYVDEMGTICWSGGKGSTTLVRNTTMQANAEF